MTNLRDRFARVIDEHVDLYVARRLPTTALRAELLCALLDVVGEVDWLDRILAGLDETEQVQSMEHLIGKLSGPQQYDLATEVLRTIYQTRIDCGQDYPVSDAYHDAVDLMFRLRPSPFDGPLARLFEAFGSYLSCELDESTKTFFDATTLDGLTGNLERLRVELRMETESRMEADAEDAQDAFLSTEQLCEDIAERLGRANFFIGCGPRVVFSTEDGGRVPTGDWMLTFDARGQVTLTTHFEPQTVELYHGQADVGGPVPRMEAGSCQLGLLGPDELGVDLAAAYYANRIAGLYGCLLPTGG